MRIVPIELKGPAAHIAVALSNRLPEPMFWTGTAGDARTLLSAPGLRAPTDAELHAALLNELPRQVPGVRVTVVADAFVVTDGD